MVFLPDFFQILQPIADSEFYDGEFIPISWLTNGLIIMNPLLVTICTSHLTLKTQAFRVVLSTLKCLMSSMVERTPPMLEAVYQLRSFAIFK